MLVVHRSWREPPADRPVHLLSVDVLTGWIDGGAVPTSALEVVDGEVRELIRRRGLDPFTDPGPVRLLVRDVVADYSERSLTSALPAIADPESVVRDVLDRVAGFGPLQRWLDDPEVEEIWIKVPLAPGCQRGLRPSGASSSRCSASALPAQAPRWCCDAPPQSRARGR